MSEIYDTAILGAGPAGISAAIYAARAKLNTLWLDKQFEQGGQVLNTYEVDNYPGMPGISGMDLGEAMAGHAANVGAFVEKIHFHRHDHVARCGRAHRHLRGLP